ncbi:NADP-dependent malic enzyme [Candidatus Roizmanbacteria bacterium]|nr:NADP-dependent malic enzyme [Candidatus Roizmanbacteria bacterium]
MDIQQESLELHKKYKGKLETASRVKIEDKHDLSLVYTPGVAAVSSYLASHKEETGNYTVKGHTVAVVSDGSAVLGLGNIGPEGALPVMEGKCVIFKHFANIDAFPLVLSTQNPDEIVQAVVAIAPSFGGINLEDIKAPQCFQIEERLKKLLDIPVIHDDQWGAAVAILAALVNALKVAQKDLITARIVISGAGAAGTAITKILLAEGAKHILVVDRMGILYTGRSENSVEKEELALLTNPHNETGVLSDALHNADVFVGVSGPGILKPEMISTMAEKSIIFALANPIPEIMPEEAKQAGAYIVGTGRSDYPNQINNALVFPGVFKGALEHKVTSITTEMLLETAHNLAALVTEPTPELIIPSVFDDRVVPAICRAIHNQSIFSLKNEHENGF